MSAVIAVNCFTMHYNAPLRLMGEVGGMSPPLRGPGAEGVPSVITTTDGIEAGAAGIRDATCPITDHGTEASMTILRAADITRERMRVTVDHTKLDTTQMIMIKNCEITTTVGREKEKRNRFGRGTREVGVTETGKMEVTVEMKDFILIIKTDGEMTGVVRARSRIRANAKILGPGNSLTNMTEKEEAIARMKNERPCRVNHRVVMLSRVRSEVRGKRKRSENQGLPLQRLEQLRRRKS